jgi:hypothetical protein
MAKTKLREEGKLVQKKQTGMLAFTVVKKKANDSHHPPIKAPAPAASTQRTDCCGVFNSFKGKYRHDLGVICQYAAIKDRRYVWGTLAGLPSLHSSECTHHGEILVNSLGCICEACLDLRQENGNSHPREFVKGWTEKLNNFFDRTSHKLSRYLPTVYVFYSLYV